MKLVRLSALHTVHFNPPRNIPGTHFFQGLRWPQGYNVASYIMSLKNVNDTIWNRTHNRLVAQSEETAPVCAPHFVIMLIELDTVLCLEVNCLCNKTTTSFWELSMQKNSGFLVSYILVALKVNKYIVERCIYTVYTGNIYTTGPYVQYK
jgi:hypothetical protein